MIEAEYGSSFPVKFLHSDEIKIYDENDNEIQIPKCGICGSKKQMAIFSDHFTWVCPNQKQCVEFY